MARRLPLADNAWFPQRSIEGVEQMEQTRARRQVVTCTCAALPHDKHGYHTPAAQSRSCDTYTERMGGSAGGPPGPIDTPY